MRHVAYAYFYVGWLEEGSIRGQEQWGGRRDLEMGADRRESKRKEEDEKESS